MRINARFDEASQRQLEYLAQVTGQSVSHVVRESVARYYAELRAQKRPPMKFLALVGQGDSGQSDIASNVKRYLSESLAAKYGLDDRRR